jgi:hypothetical protein
MATTPNGSGSPIQPLSRTTLGIAIALVTIAGLQLYIASTRTAEFFAWTIAVPITAAFLGAGYFANIPSLALAFRHREWQMVRIQVIATFVFTILILVATLRNLGQFHLSDPSPIPLVAAWAWLGVYVLLPFPLAVMFYLQERAGGSSDYQVVEPLLPWVRVFFLIHSVVLSALAIGLIIPIPAMQSIWPWPLPVLPAGAVGAWLAGIAAASWWVLREGDWRRVQIFLPTYIVFWVLQLLAAARFNGVFDPSSWKTWWYIGLGVVLLVFGVLIAVSQKAASSRAGQLAGPESEALRQTIEPG